MLRVHWAGVVVALWLVASAGAPAWAQATDASQLETTFENCQRVAQAVALSPSAEPNDGKGAAQTGTPTHDDVELRSRCRSNIGHWNITRSRDAMTDRVYCYALYFDTYLFGGYPRLWYRYRFYSDRLVVSAGDDALRGYRLRLDEAASEPWRMATPAQILNGAMTVGPDTYRRIAQARRLRVQLSQVIDSGGVADLDLEDFPEVLSVMRGSHCTTDAAPFDAFVARQELRANASRQ